MVEYNRFAKAIMSALEAEELAEVDGVAKTLADELLLQSSAIAKVHVHGAQSRAVQDLVSQILRGRLGFEEEVVLTPEIGFVTQARPDFVFRLATNRGIIAEVERGGTINNNHDLKDVWKAHISPDTHHLFLVVPQANWNEKGNVRERPYPRVCKRIAPFFGDPRREIDIVSAHVFGY